MVATPLIPALRGQRQEVLCIPGQPGLHSKFQDSWSYIEGPCLKKQSKQTPNSKVLRELYSQAGRLNSTDHADQKLLREVGTQAEKWHIFKEPKHHDPEAKGTPAGSQHKKATKARDTKFPNYLPTVTDLTVTLTKSAGKAQEICVVCLCTYVCTYACVCMYI